MKKTLTLAILILFIQNAFAQDVIVKLNGDEIPARVKEITLQNIYYQHPDSVKGLVHSITRADIFMVKFANGTKEVFEENISESEAIITPQQMYEIGRQDAKDLYKGNGAMWGSAACALVFPYGLVGSAAIGLTRPKAYNNPVSNRSYLADQNYVNGYEIQAGKKKTKKTLAGAGIGFAVIGAILATTF
jgi:hypothetical protein